MKQRVVVQAIIKDHDAILLLRRSQGRPSIVGKYELPGGTLEQDEQPDDGMRRHLKNDLGVIVHDLALHDVMAMTNREEGDVQHIFVVYLVQGIDHQTVIKPGQSYDKYEWKKTSELQHYDLRDSAIYLLGADNFSVVDISTDDYEKKLVVKKATKDKDVVIYSDGGSRGNPGPSAAAFVIVRDDIVIDQGGEYLGITTNNQAEYHGVQLGLEKAIVRNIKTLEFRIDSMLVVNQLNGLYKIKNRELWPINERIQTLLTKFERVTFKHVPRELNTMADALVNKFLDEHRSDLE